MPRGLSRWDIDDLDIVDAVELNSDGTTVIQTGVTVVSTTHSTKRVVVSGVYLIQEPDQRIEPKDRVTLSGTSGGSADGNYTVASVIDDLTFTVVENIPDSTGGLVEFRHPPGALRTGFDPVGLTHITANQVQEAIRQLDAALLWKLLTGNLVPITDGQGVVLSHTDGVQKVTLKRNSGNFEITVQGDDDRSFFKNAVTEESHLLGNDQNSYALVQNSDDEVCFIVYGDKSSRFYGPLTQGDSTSLASGPDSFAQGTGSQAEATASHAQGVWSRATNDTQHAWAGGCFSEAGDAQGSHFVLRGETPGDAVGEEVELKFGVDGDLVLGLPRRTWCILVEAVATSGTDRMCLKQMVLAKSTIGPLFRAIFDLTAEGVQEKLYTEGAATWDLRVVSVPFPTHQTRMGVMFRTGAAQAMVHVVCNVRMIETSEPVR